jgi:hypothetical protein
MDAKGWLKMNDENRFHDGAFTVPQFRAWASIGNTKVYAEVASGRLKITKVGGKTLILKADARTWLASYAAPTEAKAA